MAKMQSLMIQGQLLNNEVEANSTRFKVTF